MRKPTFPLNKGCGIVPFLSKGLFESLSMSVCLLVCLFVLIDLCVFRLKASHIFHLPESVAECPQAHSSSRSHNCGCIFPQIGCHGEGIPHPNNLTSSWQLYHSSLAGLSSRGVMAGRPSPVALWDAVRLATVCRRTRTSRQSLSRLLHSLQAAEELREVRCWHGG